MHFVSKTNHAVNEFGEEVAQRLLDHGADINARNNNAPTPLYLASQSKDNGADVNAKSLNGNTPLHTASQFGTKDVVKVLLENKPDVNAKINGHERLRRWRFWPKTMVL